MCIDWWSWISDTLSYFITMMAMMSFHKKKLKAVSFQINLYTFVRWQHRLQYAPSRDAEESRKMIQDPRKGPTPWRPQTMTAITMMATRYTMTATAMKTWRTNGVLLRNRQIHGEFTVIPSSENMFVAVTVEPPGNNLDPYQNLIDSSFTHTPPFQKMLQKPVHKVLR